MLCDFWQGASSLWNAFHQKKEVLGSWLVLRASVLGVGALGKVFQLLGKITAA